MVLKENVLDVDTYLMLRGKVKWKPLTKEQAKKALENSLTHKRDEMIDHHLNSWISLADYWMNRIGEK